jgi:hypothetical protein
MGGVRDQIAHRKGVFSMLNWRYRAVAKTVVAGGTEWLALHGRRPGHSFSEPEQHKIILKRWSSHGLDGTLGGEVCIFLVEEAGIRRSVTAEPAKWTLLIDWAGYTG